MNRPSRADYYIMRLIWTVTYLLAQNPPSHVDLDQFKIPFEFGIGPEKQTAETPETMFNMTEDQQKEYASSLSKMAWRMRIGEHPVKETKADVNGS